MKGAKCDFSHTIPAAVALGTMSMLAVPCEGAAINENTEDGKKIPAMPAAKEVKEKIQIVETPSILKSGLRERATRNVAQFLKFGKIEKFLLLGYNAMKLSLIHI